MHIEENAKRFFDYLKKMGEDHYFVFNGLLVNQFNNELINGEICLTNFNELEEMLKNHMEHLKEKDKEKAFEQLTQLLQRMKCVHLLFSAFFTNESAKVGYLKDQEEILQSELVYTINQEDKIQVNKSICLFFPIHKDDIQDKLKEFSEVGITGKVLLDYHKYTKPEDRGDSDVHLAGGVCFHLDEKACKKLIEDFEYLKEGGYLL